MEVGQVAEGVLLLGPFVCLSGLVFPDESFVEYFSLKELKIKGVEDLFIVIVGTSLVLNGLFHCADSAASGRLGRLIIVPDYRNYYAGEELVCIVWRRVLRHVCDLGKFYANCIIRARAVMILRSKGF